MRIANLRGRLVLVTADGSVAPRRVPSQQWPLRLGPPTDLRSVGRVSRRGRRPWICLPPRPFALDALGAPAPAPKQVFAIGLNYRAHAAESKFDVPDEPTVMFTKWPSCLTGPVTTVELPKGGHTDWEVELVVVMGSFTYQIAEEQAWDHVAGVTVGQDLSERITQSSGPVTAIQSGQVAARIRPNRSLAGYTG